MFEGSKDAIIIYFPFLVPITFNNCSIIEDHTFSEC